MIYSLPKSVEVNGKEYEIRSDYRACLDIITAISDQELSDMERADALLKIFYPAFDDIPEEDYQEAIDKCIWFLNCGVEEKSENRQKLMDWEQDFPLIVAPVNRIFGGEIRSAEYLHWWTFISAYQEIGDCLFAQVVAIRDKKTKGKKLDKSEMEFYKKNRNLIDFKTHYTEKEENLMKLWIGG